MSTLSPPLPFSGASVFEALSLDPEGRLRRMADRIVPSVRDLQSDETHRSEIEKKLNATFGAARVFSTGSTTKGTAIEGHSDSDLFAVLPPSIRNNDSNSVLDAVSTLLRERFPRSAARKDRPCVSVPFAQGDEKAEVTPVYYLGSKTRLGFDAYGMPDGQGGWKFASPGSHAAYVIELDRHRNGDLLRVIRLVKFWKYEKGVPIGSFFIEMSAAAFAMAANSYSIEVGLLQWLYQQQREKLRPIHDPRFPYDDLWIDPCSTSGNREHALAQIETALGSAVKAFTVRPPLENAEVVKRWSDALGAKL